MSSKINIIRYFHSDKYHLHLMLLNKLKNYKNYNFLKNDLFMILYTMSDNIDEIVNNNFSKSDLLKNHLVIEYIDLLIDYDMLRDDNTLCEDRIDDFISNFID